jgi:hypothetical protein
MLMHDLEGMSGRRSFKGGMGNATCQRWRLSATVPMYTLNIFGPGAYKKKPLDQGRNLRISEFDSVSPLRYLICRKSKPINQIPTGGSGDTVQCLETENKPWHLFSMKSSV